MSCFAWISLSRLLLLFVPFKWWREPSSFVMKLSVLLLDLTRNHRRVDEICWRLTLETLNWLGVRLGWSETKENRQQLGETTCYSSFVTTIWFSLRCRSTRLIKLNRQCLNFTVCFSIITKCRRRKTTFYFFLATGEGCGTRWRARFLPFFFKEKKSCWGQKKKMAAGGGRSIYTNWSWNCI